MTPSGETNLWRLEGRDNLYIYMIPVKTSQLSLLHEWRGIALGFLDLRAIDTTSIRQPFFRDPKKWNGA